MRTASKVIAILLALSLIGGLQNSNSVPVGTMDLKPIFPVIRLILAIIFAYFGWRPQNKNDKNNENKGDLQHNV